MIVRRYTVGMTILPAISRVKLRTMTTESGRLCGVDEAGRGPLAGPVTAAAVILPDSFPVDILDDSKRLSETRRLKTRSVIVTRAVWGVGWASHIEIDRVNILQATFLAMERAIHALSVLPGSIVVDGSMVPTFRSIPGVHVTAEPKADSRIPEVMAASILAKTARDWWMIHYGVLEPAYDYPAHKGYPTSDHRQRVAQFGPARIQRRSFRT